VSLEKMPVLKNSHSPAITVEEFRYGDVRLPEFQDEKYAGGLTRCDNLAVPESVYIRYLLEGKRIEKHLDLSALISMEWKNRIIEFDIKGESVEVWRIAPIAGQPPTRQLLMTN